MDTMDRLFRWVIEQFWGGHGDSEQLEPVVKSVPEVQAAKDAEQKDTVDEKGNVSPVE